MRKDYMQLSFFYRVDVGRILEGKNIFQQLDNLSLVDVFASSGCRRRHGSSRITETFRRMSLIRIQPAEDVKKE